MSDGETVAEIELHNVKVARMLVDYWRRQGVEIGANVDPTKALPYVDGDHPGLLGLAVEWLRFCLPESRPTRRVP